MSDDPRALYGRLVVADEGGPDVFIDMYQVTSGEKLRISAPRHVLRLYAQRLLEAGNRDDPQ